MKLLIAVRSAVMADLLASSLPAYDVHICSTGTEALTMLEALQPESLLLELSLPVMDGLTLLRKSRHQPAHILALTTLATAAVLQEAADAGVQDIILIPCTVKQIAKQLDALTENAPSPDA